MKSNFIKFEEARDFVIKLNLTSANEWRKYASSGNRPYYIPSHPDRVYKNCGWVNWNYWLGTNNLQGGNKKYSVNENFFKEFTNDMAYILGFWCADGYILGGINLFSITQHKNDKYLMESILLKMNSNYKLRNHGDNNLAFYIRSSEIVKDVKKIISFTHKTYDLKFPDIPKEFLADFIRGFWDGDGCITYQKNEKCYTSSCISASGDLIKELLNVLRENIDGFIGTIRCYKNYHYLSAGVNDTRRLAKFLYGNITEESLYLKRKYEKFKNSGEITPQIRYKNFLEFNEAKKFIKELGIKNIIEWKNYKKQNKIDNIPSRIGEYYLGKGWVNWKEFIS